MTEEIIYFFTKTGDWFELSNFYPQGFEEDGLYWPTVEHYFQAMKFRGDDLAEYRDRIRRADGPRAAKDLGRTRSIPIRPDWDGVRDEIMLHALRRKFAHPKLGALLRSSGSRPLAENSPHDYYWGTGADGSGQNRLGQLLMQVRDELGRED